MHWSHQLAKPDGIFVGIRSGATSQVPYAYRRSPKGSVMLGMVVNDDLTRHCVMPGGLCCIESEE
jgi:hypothetical protein